MLDLTEAISVVVTTLDLDPNITASRIESQLQKTKGFVSGTTPYYRPYYVIGMELWLDPSNNLISGEGATFDQNFEVCRRYMLWQLRYDKADNVTIPIEFSVETFLENMREDTDEVPPANSVFKLGVLGF